MRCFNVFSVLAVLVILVNAIDVSGGEKEKLYDQLVCRIGTNDLKEFRELAKEAKRIGATHIVISPLAERTDYRGDNVGSPWCEWNMDFPSIFKHATPKGMEDMYPKVFVSRQMKLMKAKHAVVKELGLRAAYNGLEPHWISERVYAKHPEWRGTRTDNSLRTVGMFFAPNTDHPEVKQLYRSAVKKIVEDCPLIDIFWFHTNDCGANYPWSLKSYTNHNGPGSSFGGDMGVRIADFLKTIRQGAREGGVEARVFARPFMMTTEEQHLLKRSLKPGIGVTWGAPDSLAAECQLGSAGGWGDRFVKDFGTPFSVISGVSRIKQSSQMRFIIGSSKTFFKAFEVAMAEPPAGNQRERMQVAAKIAAALYSDEVVDDVVDAWYTIQRVQNYESAVGMGYLYYAVKMLRWITRPLVPHQDMLTEAERNYWEPFIYQSKGSQPDTYLDYLNLTGTPLATNWWHAAVICCNVDGINDAYRQAASCFAQAARKVKSSELKKKLETEAAKCRIKACFARTVAHALQMGTLIKERDKDPKKASIDPEPIPQSNDGSMGSPGLFMMHRTMRWELENMNELISILENSREPLLVTAENAAREGALKLSPNTLAHLKKKVRIMLKYWRSAEKGYYRSTKGG